MNSNKTTADRQHLALPGGLVTHTTARIRGTQTAAVSVRHAMTADAAVTLLWGGTLMRFLSAAAQGVLEGFATASSALMGVEYQALAIATPGDVEEFARPTYSIDWTRRPTYAVVRQHGYSTTYKRTVYWVDLHMGPITWQILDVVGYRTAVGVCLDGRKYRGNPTSDTYERQE